MSLQIRRGLQSELDQITPLEGEPIWVTDQEKLVIGDGITQGGINVTANLQDLLISSQGTKTSLYNSISTGSVALTNGTNSNEIELRNTGTFVSGPLFVSTTASVTTLRFADGSVQTTADTANYDQSLNTTDKVTFAGMTLTNIAEFSTSSVRFLWPGHGANNIFQLEDYGIRLSQGTVYGPNDSDTEIITGGGTPTTSYERNAAVKLKNGPTNIANFNTSTFTIYKNGQQSIYSNTLGTITLGNGSGATNIASSSDTELTLGSPQNTHNILLSTTEAKIRGKNSVEIVTLTTSTTTINTNLTVNGDITANKLTIQYTTVTTTIVETDDIIKTTNSTAAGSGVGAIVATGGVSANNLFVDTTATITYTNVGTAAQLRSQSSNFPLGQSTATIMTIATAIYSSARLQICVGATLGLDSHTERLTMDILTNGTDVLNAQSGLLSTTSTGICSYSAVLSGTDILVKAELIDPINFLGSELNVLAELVANPMV
jgi:hypothetical protein